MAGPADFQITPYSALVTGSLSNAGNTSLNYKEYLWLTLSRKEGTSSHTKDLFNLLGRERERERVWRITLACLKAQQLEIEGKVREEEDQGIRNRVRLTIH